MPPAEVAPPAGTADAARAWRAALPPEARRPSTARGALLFSLLAAVWIGSFVGSFLAPTSWLRFVSQAVGPFVIGGLFLLGHDAAHHTLVRGARLNRLLGRLSMLPAFHPFAPWRHLHTVLHHGGTNLKGRNPDFVPLSKDEYDRLPRWRRLLERAYRSAPGIGLYYVAHMLVRPLLIPDRRLPAGHAAFHLDRLLVVAFFALQLWVGYELSALTPDLALPRWLITVSAVVLPWATWVWFGGVLTYLQHTHPRVPWYDDAGEWDFYDAQVRTSVRLTLPRWIERLSLSVLEHPAHHVDPAVSPHQLPAGQKALEACAPEAVVVRLTLREYLRICRTCKLYDYRRHCWLDFAGNPTTPEGLNNQ
jgi:acyl-lipid omega-6 desaturase (Delta-12 desaturase)